MALQSDIDGFLSLREKDPRLLSLWETLLQRASVQTVLPGVAQPGDTLDWRHLIESRMCDAAFSWHLTKDARLGAWLRDTVLRVCGLDGDEWIGPWFRPRSTPPEGQLETAHICVSLATALDLCGGLFSPEETSLVKSALREKGMEPCGRYLKSRRNGEKNNWYMVLLDGYVSVAAVLGDGDALAEAYADYDRCCALYNGDSYGESLQYWDYASRKLCHAYQVIKACTPDKARDLALPFTRMTPWACASLMFTRDGCRTGQTHARCLNFGDSAATYRISGDLALGIARYARDKLPKEAGLARWLFERGYRDVDNTCNDLSSFGFINNFGYLTLLNYAGAAPALSPEEAGLPSSASFEVGHIIIRDSYAAPKTVVSMQGGFVPLRVAAHRHQDLNSFVVSHLGEIIFADPGHCCYRTRTHDFSKSGASHSVWRFFTENGDCINQSMVSPANMETPICRLRFVKSEGCITATASDAAKAYGPYIKTADRILVAVLPNTLFIIDTILSDIPVRVESNFIVNNRDNKLKYNVASSDRLVLRRNGTAAKFFLSRAQPACGFSFSYASIHDSYHPLPNMPGQGKEGSGLIFTHSSVELSRRHTMVYAIAMSGEAEITGWHIGADAPGVFAAEAPGGKYRNTLELKENGFTACSGLTGDKLYISPALAIPIL